MLSCSFPSDMTATAALVPFDPVLGDSIKNIEKIGEICDQAISERHDMIVFPELATCGYLLENLVDEASLTIVDSVWDRLKNLSRYADIIIGAAIRHNHRIYNAAILFQKGKIEGMQFKIYLPTYGMFDEFRYFTSGDKLNLFETCAGKTGVLVCEDAWHPAIAYALYLKRAENIFVISASPSRGLTIQTEHFSSYEMWIKRMEIYAQSFGNRYIYLNRSGIEDGVTYGGQIAAVGPLSSPVELSKKPYASFKIDNSELTRAALAGGPFKEENVLLNHELIQDAIDFMRHKQPSDQL